MPSTKCQAALAELTAANPLPRTCLWFLCKAWRATSSWHCRCLSLIAHVCRLISFPSCILTALELPFFLITYVSSVSWRNIWERLMIYCLVWKKLTRKVGYNFVLVWKLCFSLWCLKPMLQITVFQLLLQQLITMTNSLGCEEAFMTLPKQFLRGSAWFFFFFLPNCFISMFAFAQLWTVYHTR